MIEHIVDMMVGEGVPRSEANLIAEVANHARTVAFEALIRVVDGLPPEHRGKGLIVCLAMMEASIVYAREHTLERHGSL